MVYYFNFLCSSILTLPVIYVYSKVSIIFQNRCYIAATLRFLRYVWSHTHTRSLGYCRILSPFRSQAPTYLHTIRPLLLNIFSIKSASNWEFSSPTYPTTPIFTGVLGLSTSLEYQHNFFRMPRPHLMWGSGTSRFSLISTRRLAVAYLGKFPVYQRKISSIVTRMYCISSEDITSFIQFNILHILRVSGIIPVSSGYVTAIALGYISCNFFTVRSSDFVCSLCDFITLSPLY